MVNNTSAGTESMQYLSTLAFWDAVGRLWNKIADVGPKSTIISLPEGTADSPRGPSNAESHVLRDSSIQRFRKGAAKEKSGGYRILFYFRSLRLFMVVIGL